MRRGDYLLRPLVSTFSVFALAFRNGDSGVAVQSKYFSVDSVARTGRGFLKEILKTA